MAGEVGPRARAGITTPLWSAGEYAAPLPRLISQAKDHHRWDAIALLAVRLAYAVAGLADAAGLRGAGVLVPFPSQAKTVRSRGLDVTWTLAVRACRNLRAAGMAVVPARVLAHSRAVADQGDLTSEARATNLVGALHVAARPPPGWLVLVDDVVTTGASLREAVRACVHDGLVPAGLATVAATELRT